MSKKRILQFSSDANYASLVVGFPELEFSSNEVYAWPKSDEAVKCALYCRS